MLKLKYVGDNMCVIADHSSSLSKTNLFVQLMGTPENKLIRLPLVDLDGGFSLICQQIFEGSIEDGDCALYCLDEEYKEGKENSGQTKSIHGSVHILQVNSSSTKSIQYEPTNEFKFMPVSAGSTQDFVVSVPTWSVNIFLRLPSWNFKANEILNVKNIQIESIDVSIDGSKYVAGGVDGRLWVGNLSDGKMLAPLKGHVSDITCTKFVSFPSGQVIVSASIDFSIRIFSVLNGSNPRTLMGHTRTITSVEIIGKGKYIVSGALDGFVRVWNVGNAECVQHFRLGSSSSSSDQVGIVSLICARTHNFDNQEEKEQIESSSEYDVALKGIVIYASLTDGSVIRIDPLSQTSHYTATFLPAPTPKCPAVLDYDVSNRILVVGSESGCVSVYADDNATNAINEKIIPARYLFSFKAPGSMILHTVRVLATPSASDTEHNWNIYIAAYDNHPYRVSIPQSVLFRLITDNESDIFDITSLQTLWFSGISYDPVHALCVSQQTKSVYLAATDGVIRRYQY